MENRLSEGPACRGLNPELFFPDPKQTPAPDITPALQTCATCPVDAHCLAEALQIPNAVGIWSGILFDIATTEITAALKAKATGDGPGLIRAINEARATTARYVTGETIGRPWVEEHDCPRCGTTIEAGRHPEDTNGPNARCELVSTYNKGSRCWKSRKAKSRYHQKTKR